MGGKYIKFEILVVQQALDHMPESSLPVYIFLDVLPHLLFDLVLGLIESNNNSLIAHISQFGLLLGVRVKIWVRAHLTLPHLLEWMSVISGVNFSSDMTDYSYDKSSKEYKQQ